MAVIDKQLGDQGKVQNKEKDIENQIEVPTEPLEKIPENEPVIEVKPKIQKKRKVEAVEKPVEEVVKVSDPKEVVDKIFGQDR